jgi:ABC-type glycerol-3-phosphate transport system substrate-binding protein
VRHRIVLALAAAWCLVASLSADAADKKVVRIWQTESEPQSLVVLDQIAANFQKLRPDVEIKIEGLA